MYLGGDLSYINEIEDAGGRYYQNGEAKDPFAILKDCGANIARVRLWHTPTWTAYCNLADVQRTIWRAKQQNMAVMLDFHYSDTWADPGKQIIPAAWAGITELSELEQAVYEYTLETLLELDKQELMPEFVQVGNEINTEILMPGPYNGENIRWERNAKLINAGISGVREAGKQTNIVPQIILHIAQPENLIGWFDDALAAGVTDFDIIGLSYYPKWSTCSLEQTGETIHKARQRFGKPVMVVEAAYPWTQTQGKAESHLLAEDAVLPEFPATPEGQRDYLIALTRMTQENGGIGVVYWEPAWISAPGKPSIWENAALFDYEGHTHKGIEFLSHTYNVQPQK